MIFIHGANMHLKNYLLIRINERREIHDNIRTGMSKYRRNKVSPNSPQLSLFISLRVTESGVLKYMAVQPIGNRHRLYSMSLVRW